MPSCACYRMEWCSGSPCAAPCQRRGQCFLLKGFALFSTGLAIFGIYAATLGSNIFTGDDAQAFAVIASFINRNNYATYAIFGVLANIAAYLHSLSASTANEDRWESFLRDLLERFFSDAWIYAVGTLICLAALGLTQSRAGGLSGVVGVVVFAACWQRRGTRRNPWLIATLVVVVVFVALTNGSDLMSRLLATSAENARFTVYPQVLTGILDRPLLGHGLGAFCGRRSEPTSPRKPHTGNGCGRITAFWKTLMNWDCLPPCRFMARVGLIALRIRRGTQIRKKNRAFSCFAFAVICAAATHSLFDFSLQIPAGSRSVLDDHGHRLGAKLRRTPGRPALAIAFDDGRPCQIAVAAHMLNIAVKPIEEFTNVSPYQRPDPEPHRRDRQGYICPA